ncbi:hypothetical protein IQ07DRAFT_661264 [Pyrenochaeta sp. DS3sAY3a]|nr:hypothetical protein IQ07DRAFT_661264 [Pyrenochaeta sp. DS3sAY3a]
MGAIEWCAALCLLVAAYSRRAVPSPAPALDQLFLRVAGVPGPRPRSPTASSNSRRETRREDEVIGCPWSHLVLARPWPRSQPMSQFVCAAIGSLLGSRQPAYAALRKLTRPPPACGGGCGGRPRAFQSGLALKIPHFLPILDGLRATS